MKQKHLYLYLVMAAGLLCPDLFAQEASSPQKRLSIGVEFGTNSANTQLTDQWSVRKGALSPYFYEYDDYNTDASFNSLFFGVKSEYALYKDILSVSSGIRYRDFNTSFDRNPYFFLLHKEQGDRTDYLRIKEITETSHYLGVPIELICAPDFPLLRNKTWSIAFYTKLGGEVGAKLHTSRSIDFYNEAMKQYEEELIKERCREITPIYASLYYAFGLRFGKPNSVRFNIEGTPPAFVFTNKVSSFMNVKNLGGLQLSLLVPIK